MNPASTISNLSPPKKWGSKKAGYTLPWWINHFQYIFLVTVLLIASSANAKDAEMPYILGANVHFGQFIDNPTHDPQKTNEALRRYGFTSFRDGLAWSELSKSSDLSFPLRLKRQKEHLEITYRDIRPLLVYVPGDPTYNNGYLPTTELAIDNFASYAKKAAIITSKYSPIFEIWNEWNLGTGTRRRLPGTAADYIFLIKKTYPELKRLKPTATILVGGMATDVDPDPVQKREWVWTKQAIDMGLLKYGDGLSVHFYNICRPKNERTPAEIITRLEKLDILLRQSNDGKAYPIYITETGWPEKIMGCGFTDEEQIDFSAQFLFWVTKFESVKGVWIYQLKDNGLSEQNIEHHFGLLNYAYTEKPVMRSIQDVRKTLLGSVFSNESISPSGRVTISLKNQNGLTFDILWLMPQAGLEQYVIPVKATARRICDDKIYKEGETVILGSRPLIVTLGE